MSVNTNIVKYAIQTTAGKTLEAAPLIWNVYNIIYYRNNCLLFIGLCVDITLCVESC